MPNILKVLLIAFSLLLPQIADAADTRGDYRLGPGDAIRIVVFQNPDLTLDSRVTEGGTITYPLIGGVAIGGLTIEAAEQKIAAALKEGGFVQQPQVNIVLQLVRGNQVSVLGQVNRPGRFPLETFNTRISEMLAIAGGAAQTGADIVIITGTRDGKPMRKEIDIPRLFLDKTSAEDIVVAGGDVIYVHRAPMYYIYGETQRPGSFRIERDMTVRQALAQGGGPTQRGDQDRLRLHRRNAEGRIEALSPELDNPVLPDDIIYVRESFF
jgi:polysaccharide export outer membrane protein